MNVECPEEEVLGLARSKEEEEEEEEYPGLGWFSCTSHCDRDLVRPGRKE